jgi:CRP/FNR family transcriptional regulator
MLDALRQACRFCSLYELCWPIGFSPVELDRVQSIVKHTEALPTGSHLFRVGDQFTAIYAMRSGCIKSYSLSADGHEQVHGFHLRGECLGFDAVYPARHCCNAVVLQTASACIIPFNQIDRLSTDFPGLRSQILQLMSREFSRHLLLDCGSDAMHRVAAFLLDIFSRLNRADTVEFEFRLPMSREDIASYLCISPETLSRLLAKLQQKQLIAVDRRQICLLEPMRLDRIAQGLEVIDLSSESATTTSGC